MGRRSEEPQITQEEIRAYQALRESIASAKEQRLDFIARLDNRAEVETGPLTLTLKEFVSVRASWSGLAELLGDQRVDWIRARIEPSTSRHLCVVENPDYGSLVRRAKKRKW